MEAVNHKAQSLYIVFIALIVVLPLIVWGLSLFLSKTKELSFATYLQRSWTRALALMGKSPILFALSLLLIIVTQPLIMQPKGTAFSMLGSLTNLAAFICMLGCQIITYKSNSDLFEPSGQLAHRNNFVMGYHLMVLQLFLFFASLLGLLFLAVPALLLKVYTFIASPISVCESKSLGAIGRSLKLSKSHFWDICKISIPFLLCTNAPLIILPALKNNIDQPMLMGLALIVFRFFEFLCNTLTWQCQSLLYDYLKQNNDADNQG